MSMLNSHIRKQQNRLAFDGLLDERTRDARAEGVDVSTHSEWSRFLGDPSGAPCEQRYADYREKKRHR
ncbi:MAG: hypothetical protein AB7P24_14100 [Nitrospira sp.]